MATLIKHECSKRVSALFRKQALINQKLSVAIKETHNDLFDQVQLSFLRKLPEM